jgi:hypothetical protein
MATKKSGSELRKLRKLTELEKQKNAKQWASWLTKSSATKGGNSECVVWATVEES